MSIGEQHEMLIEAGRIVGTITKFSAEQWAELERECAKEPDFRWLRHLQLLSALRDELFKL